ncbi:hypothetical protein M5E82_12085 [Parabacteroides distasonis]|nr:hypothetical protein M5E82_12085 [Parabacteroides distasonis]
MGQVFWENMLLMLPGGMAGLLFSYVLVSVFRGILLSPVCIAWAPGRVTISSSRRGCC